MTLTDTQLKADLRFPRLNREIAAKLIRACRKGRFGLLFQQQVEQERSRSGGMPNGRCMLRAIFRHFQLERDGKQSPQHAACRGSLQDLEDFRDKYLYVPDADLPKPSTMFNHLTDELDKCPALKQKVEKARESKPGSHRRTTEWLWNRVDIALELHQQKINRQEFDRTLRGKPQVLGPNAQLPKALTRPLLLLHKSHCCCSSSHTREGEEKEDKERGLRSPGNACSQQRQGKGQGQR